MNALMNMLKKFLPKRASDGGHPHPTRDWLILLVVTLALLGGSVAWNVWFFGTMAQAEVAVPAGGENALETYPAGTIQEVFGKRGGMETSYRSVFRFVDPSR